MQSFYNANTNCMKIYALLLDGTFRLDSFKMEKGKSAE